MYDYVIVGAGSAGCVLAARLSEDPDVKVLLLEAGPPDVKEKIHVPIGFLSLGKTDVDWDYSTAPEPFCSGRRVYLPRGRTLGGSSSINAMIYIRGNRRDYDAWGIPGWTWDDLFPYFLRSEDNERGASEWHATGGPLAVSEGRSRNPISAAWVQAAQSAGLAPNEDFNGPEQDGVGLYQLTQRNGLRCSTAVAFLHPAMERENLTVEPWMQVNRVLFEGTRAVGVEAQRLGEVSELRAEREIILCGGSYNSPQILMLSGIGPAEHLTLREIEVLLDQPAVGQNLSDHCQVSNVWRATEPVSLLLALEPGALEEFNERASGPLTSNLAEAGGFVRTRPELEAPDIQFHVAPVMIVDEGLSDPPDHGVWAAPALLQPESRGAVTLASNDPTAKPIIRHNYYAAEADMATMAAGMRTLMEIARQPALRSYCAEPHLVPASDDEDTLRPFIARNTITIYHPVGTCALGQVVDPELRVTGVEGLRVVDASVMPVLPRGNTNAPTIAIAERAADLIRGTVPLSATEAATAA